MGDVPAVETVDVTIAGQSRRLRIAFAALSRIAREQPDADPFRLLDQLLIVEGDVQDRRIRVTNPWALHVLLWAALMHETPTTTLDEVAALIDAHRAAGGTVLDLAVAVWGAWEVGGVRRTAEDDAKNVGAEATVAN